MKANAKKTKRAVSSQRLNKLLIKRNKIKLLFGKNPPKFGQIKSKQKMATIDNVSFGEHLRELRENSNLPLRKVAAELDIDTSTLSKIEKNARNANEQIIDGIARIFNIDKAELKIRYLSDKITYELLGEEDGIEILKVAEEKIKYYKERT